MSNHQSQPTRWRWVAFAGAFIAWPVVYVLTLQVVGELVSQTLKSDNMQGYWAFIGLFSALGVIPLGLIVSCVIYVRSRRLSWFLMLATASAAVMALVPVAFGMVSYK